MSNSHMPAIGSKSCLGWRSFRITALLAALGISASVSAQETAEVDVVNAAIDGRAYSRPNEAAPDPAGTAPRDIGSRRKLDAAYALDHSVYHVGPADIRKVRGLAPSGESAGSNAALEIAAETVQVLGQVVADRATQATFERVRSKLLEELGCKVMVTAELQGGVNFPTVCRRLEDLHLRDVIASRDALVAALVVDLTAGLRATGHASFPLEPTQETLTAIAFATDGHLDDSARLLSGELVARARRTYAGSQSNASVLVGQANFEGPLVIGVGAFLRCKVASAGGAFGGRIEQCPAEEFAREMYDELFPPAVPPTEPNPLGRSFSLRIATQLVLLNAQYDDASKFPRRKLRIATELVFDVSCYLDTRGAELCRPLEKFGKRDKAQDEMFSLSAARRLILDALSGDTATLVSDGSRVIDWFADSDGATQTNTAKKSALSTLAAILQYSATYLAPQADESAEDTQARRELIVSELASTLNARATRGGDWIASFGGSLNIAAGASFPIDGPAKPVAAGPFSLPLGFALDYVPPDLLGFHVEVSATDVGQYLAWERSDTRVVVKKPKIEDLLAPGLAVGVSFGREFPFAVAGFARYVPNYGAETEQPALGALTVGLQLGVYVPLLDLN